MPDLNVVGFLPMQNQMTNQKEPDYIVEEWGDFCVWDGHGLKNCLCGCFCPCYVIDKVQDQIRLQDHKKWEASDSLTSLTGIGAYANGNSPGPALASVGVYLTSEEFENSDHFRGQKDNYFFLLFVSSLCYPFQVIRLANTFDKDIIMEKKTHPQGGV
jgi:hypothetical protein